MKWEHYNQEWTWMDFATTQFIARNETKCWNLSQKAPLAPRDLWSGSCNEITHITILRHLQYATIDRMVLPVSEIIHGC